jgi:allantoin racemase
MRGRRLTKLLVINSNSSKAATKQIEAGCNRHVLSTTDVTYVNPTDGPEGIDTPLDVALSAVETVRVIAKNRHAFDAFVVACGDDPGLDAARQVTDKPVIGIAEAGMLMALPLGAKFSLLTLLRSEVPWMEEMVVRYGLSARLASIVTLDVSAAQLISKSEGSLEQFSKVARRAVDESMAEVIVLVGSVMCGLERPLTEMVGVPVLSGMVCAVKLAEAMASLGLRTSHVYKYHTPQKLDKLIGYEDFQSVYGSGQETR